MRIKECLFVFSALVFLFTAVSCDNNSRAQDSQIQFSNNFAGSFVNGTTDINNDGFNAAVLSLQGRSSALGPNLLDSKLELVPVFPAEPCITPNGEEGFIAALVQGAMVVTLDDNEQIFIALDSLEECVGDNLVSDPSFSFDGAGTVTGGVGEFEGASGEITFSGTGAFQISDVSGFFGSTNGELKGVIELN